MITIKHQAHHGIAEHCIRWDKEERNERNLFAGTRTILLMDCSI